MADATATICTACGDGPIHPANGRIRCVCSMVRAGIGVCRWCATCYDLVHHGSSKLGDEFAGTNPDDFRSLVAIVDRGRWVAMCGKLA